ASSKNDLPHTKPRPITPAAQRPVPKPNAPPKPVSLRTGGPSETVKGSSPKSSSTERFLDEDDLKHGEDWEKNFSKKYQSLSGLEMVETHIEPGGLRTKNV